MYGSWSLDSGTLVHLVLITSMKHAFTMT